MKTYSVQDILSRYIESGLIMHEASNTGDYKTFNREGGKIIKVYKYLEKNINLAGNALPCLFKYDDVVVRSEAAAHCLGLNIHIKEAENVLEKDSKNVKNGLYRSNAELTLKAWRQQGFLKFYRTKEDKESHLKKQF